MAEVADEEKKRRRIAVIRKQQRWLLFFRHASTCQAPDGQCASTPHCHMARALLNHIRRCAEPSCTFPRCVDARALLKHYTRCRNPGCPVCIPVRRSIEHAKVELAKRVREEGEEAAAPPPLRRRVLAQHAGTSLLETFDHAMIDTHIAALRREVSASDGGRRQSAPTSTCRSCGGERFMLEPPVLHCGTCNVRIRRHQVYHVGQEEREVWCHPCRLKAAKIGGAPSAIKRKHDEEFEEAWVCCDVCSSWHHQVCALFNSRLNEGESAFACAECCQRRLGMTLAPMTGPEGAPKMAAATADALPTTRLSDFLQARLDASLRAERQERAFAASDGREPREAENLVVRVVSCVDKEVAVKARFAELFPGAPRALPYRSKCVLLFQRIDGVDVCLFAMYTQEYGQECPAPNARRCYLSYLDSVKHFRPDGVRSAVTSEALRTFVYHDLLNGYLQHLHLRGFTSMYIWVCPPTQGDDYILYCHPAEQRMPKMDALRKWYLRMLRRGEAEGSVASVSTFYDTFFERRRFAPGGAGPGLLPTPADLPYFDEDYWPGRAEELLAADAGADANTKKQAKPRDQALMLRIGEFFGGGMKEDFIMVHLRPPCSHCGKYIAGGPRYRCTMPQCRSAFDVCASCLAADAALPDSAHTGNGCFSPSGRHLHPHCVMAEATAPLQDTRDPDGVIESETCDQRHAFLSTCKANHYQFDTLRRAKHSSMMVLYHLHNPTPVFVRKCDECDAEIATDAGYKCGVCPDYDVCASCLPGVQEKHQHILRPAATDAAETQPPRQAQLARTMELLVHASGCAGCSSRNCMMVKALFAHGGACATRTAGGCPLCRRMWSMLTMHASHCSVPGCPVPSCAAIKEFARNEQQRHEDRRRQNFVTLHAA